MSDHESVIIEPMCTMNDYPPGLIGTVANLFGRYIARTHHVDWTLDAMIAEQQCEFFRRFIPDCDRVWVATRGRTVCGSLTIDGPRPEAGRPAARLRFFILDESVRGCGVGRQMLSYGMRFSQERAYSSVYLTTLPGLDAALHLYKEHGFRRISSSGEDFHGSQYPEETWEWQKS